MHRKEASPRRRGRDGAGWPGGGLQPGSPEAETAKRILAAAVGEIERGVFSIASARRAVAGLLAACGLDDSPPHTIATWCEEWLARKAARTSSATMSRYRGNVGRFLAWLGENRAAKPLETIAPADARAWAVKLAENGRSPKTVFAHVADLRGVWRAAINEGLVATNPFSSIEAPTSGGLKREPFTPAEVKALVAAAEGEWKGLVLLGAFAGMRLGDAAGLRWDAIDLATDRITFAPAKTQRSGRLVTVPIHPDLRAYLAELPRPIHGSGPVFPAASRETVGGRTGLSRQFTDIMAGAGISRGEASAATGPGGRTVHQRGFHGLRHSFVAMLRAAGVSEENRMSLTGHSTREAHATYSHADADALRDAVQALPKIS